MAFIQVKLALTIIFIDIFRIPIPFKEIRNMKKVSQNLNSLKPLNNPQKIPKKFQYNCIHITKIPNSNI